MCGASVLPQYGAYRYGLSGRGGGFLKRLLPKEGHLPGYGGPCRGESSFGGKCSSCHDFSDFRHQCPSGKLSGGGLHQGALHRNRGGTDGEFRSCQNQDGNVYSGKDGGGYPKHGEKGGPGFTGSGSGHKLRPGNPKYPGLFSLGAGSGTYGAGAEPDSSLYAGKPDCGGNPRHSLRGYGRPVHAFPHGGNRHFRLQGTNSWPGLRHGK